MSSRGAGFVGGPSLTFGGPAAGRHALSKVRADVISQPHERGSEDWRRHFRLSAAHPPVRRHQRRGFPSPAIGDLQPVDIKCAPSPPTSPWPCSRGSLAPSAQELSGVLPAEL